MKHASWYQAPSLNDNVRGTLLSKREMLRSNILGGIALVVMIAPFFWMFVEKLSK